MYLVKCEFWEFQKEVFCFRRPTALKLSCKNLCWKQEGMHRAWNTSGTSHTTALGQGYTAPAHAGTTAHSNQPSYSFKFLNCSGGMVAQWEPLWEDAERRWGNWESKSWAAKSSEPPQKGHCTPSPTEPPCSTALLGQALLCLWQGVRS